MGQDDGKTVSLEKMVQPEKPVERLVVEIKAPDWEDSACGKDKCWDVGILGRRNGAGAGEREAQRTATQRAAEC